MNHHQLLYLRTLNDILEKQLRDFGVLLIDQFEDVDDLLEGHVLDRE